MLMLAVFPSLDLPTSGELALSIFALVVAVSVLACNVWLYLKGE